MRLTPSLPRTVLPCIAAALLACACDRLIAPCAPPTGDPSSLAKAAEPSSKTASREAPAAKPVPAPRPSPSRPPSDAQITADVAAGMRDDPALAGADLTVHTEHGVVSVTGTVQSPEQVAEAETRAAAPAGVMRVDTHLSMTPP